MRANNAMRDTIVLAALVAALATAPAARAFDPVVEAKNFSKILERERYVTGTPEYQAQLQQQNLRDDIEWPLLVASDPERDFVANICSHRQNECAGDVRFYDWQKKGHGLVQPVLYTARDGATISGNVWATKAGPAKRPGIVITTGGLAPETLYWGLAATLAKHGYVVLTYEVQGQGRSDTYGEPPDRQSGPPDPIAERHYFLDGTEDGLDFLLSTPKRPFRPRLSCGELNGGMGTDHSAKQLRRVAEGRNAAFNPFWKLVDPKRIGVAGHSMGAFGVSYIGQADPRVDALVAWDNLIAPTGAPPCPSNPASRVDRAITKPALGMSADYHQPPEPYTADPDPQSKNEGFSAYEAAGVDSMQVNIRGGTHYEFSFLPGSLVHYPFGTATLRGMDMVAWYTTAWLDRYVKCQGDRRCQQEAATRLLSDRWRNDRRGGEVDPDGDPNLFSFYLRSPFALRLPGGQPVICGDMRTGCPSMGPDPVAPDYDYFQDSTTPDP